MSAGVDDAVRREAVRQVDVSAGVAEAELQHGDPRNLVTLAQGVHFGSDVAQVFGEEWQAAQRVAQLVEQFILRAIHPAAVHGGGSLAGISQNCSKPRK